MESKPVRRHAEKHYAERDWKRLHAAQEQLEKVLGLTKATAEPPKPVSA